MRPRPLVQAVVADLGASYWRETIKDGDAVVAV